ncbi:hypothetical protein SAMN04488523_11450 [Sulfitobacter brevis]|uniref:Homeodomain-like domain-containing protein n=1 Tax=Sulfitobacter brevis TaxID=74348 RepID=A0A1I2F2M8_9RHOB|nr:helix-turn-helix domain-containing protein [Sulfitobacter brevis]SFE99269.1 hypothetical protein SAMN04488523_11450 [Sulfitobacter brevis]
MKTGRPKRLKLEQRIELARRYHAGETPKVLSEAYGVSRRHVTRLAKEEQGEGLAVRDPSERVSFRASASELEAFDAEWQTRGFANRSQALNAVLRGRCGFLDVPRDLVAEFCASWRQAKDVSDAGLVLAKAVHRGKVSVSSEDRALLVSLLDLAQCMRRELGQMKDAAQVRRKQDWPLKEEGDVALLAHPAELARVASGLRSVAGKGDHDAARAPAASAPHGGAALQAGRAVIDWNTSNG